MQLRLFDCTSLTPCFVGNKGLLEFSCVLGWERSDTQRKISRTPVLNSLQTSLRFIRVGGSVFCWCLIVVNQVFIFVLAL